MGFNNLINYFLPEALRENRTHPRYDELRTVLTVTVVGLPLVLLFLFVIYSLGYSYLGFLINGIMVFTIILSIKFFAHYRIPMTITAIVTYVIIYRWIESSGMIYSPNLALLHMYLLAAILADKKYGWLMLFSNLALFIFIYNYSKGLAIDSSLHHLLGGAEYALVMNCLITIFFGGFLAFSQISQEKDRAKIRMLQEERIGVLDRVVQQRTEQLNTIRETIARDFHDQTGNILAAITQQASLLKLKGKLSGESLAMVENIIRNSDNLYGSSRDFLWHLNHNSDDPEVVFEHLSAFGQNFYNQFDIAFSAHSETCSDHQLHPSASLDLLLIFKEAMTNTVKHSGAKEVKLHLFCLTDWVGFEIKDNGCWKKPDDDAHFGIASMRSRAEKNNFEMELICGQNGTKIVVRLPVIKYKSGL